MSGLITLEQLNEALADRLEDLLPDLVGGKAVRGEWVAASTSDGGPGDSLSVKLRGAGRGKWYHFGAGVGGDPLGLINYVRFANADMKAAYRWARDFLGGRLAPETEKARELRLKRLQNHKRQEDRAEAKKRGRARFHFLFDPKTVADWQGTPAWHYLDNRLQGRLARLGHRPGCIRYHPALYNSQLSSERQPVKLPAMIAGIVDAQGELIALHRTWLLKRGAGDDSWDRLRPDDVAHFGGRTSDGRALNGKKVLGSWRGGTIRLWNGRRINRDTAEVKLGVQWPRLGPGSAIMLCEGIETGLSLALAMPERRIVTTVSVDGFADVVLPPMFTQVTIAADRDEKNERQHASTQAAIARAREAHALAGRHLQIVYPPEGIDDWNTALKQAGRAA